MRKHTHPFDARMIAGATPSGALSRVSRTSRRIAIRYYKLASSFLGAIPIACTVNYCL